jgi:hypothetical protein
LCIEGTDVLHHWQEVFHGVGIGIKSSQEVVSRQDIGVCFVEETVRVLAMIIVKLQCVRAQAQSFFFGFIDARRASKLEALVIFSPSSKSSDDYDD